MIDGIIYKAVNGVNGGNTIRGGKRTSLRRSGGPKVRVNQADLPRLSGSVNPTATF